MRHDQRPGIKQYCVKEGMRNESCAKVRGTWPAALCMAFAANATPVAPYVEVDGSVGIDTGYCAKNSTRCEIDYETE